LWSTSSDNHATRLVPCDLLAADDIPQLVKSVERRSAFRQTLARASRPLGPALLIGSLDPMVALDS